MTASGPWYSLSLGDGQLAPGPAAEIADLFWPLHRTAGNPKAMAVFTRHESEGRLHCEVIAYFSPAAGLVARQVGAEPCAPPTRHELGLLAGDPDCWSALFPEANA